MAPAEIRGISSTSSSFVVWIQLPVTDTDQFNLFTIAVFKTEQAIASELVPFLHCLSTAYMYAHVRKMY